MTKHVVIDAGIDDVWDVLCDGWLYPVFVVGSARMRSVDATWPAVGSTLHHSFGSWPLMIDDTTSVVACDPGRRLELTARGWPMGEARIVFTLTATAGRTRVVLEETPTKGPGALVPGFLAGPAIDLRNGETLQRLELLARGRAGR